MNLSLRTKQDKYRAMLLLRADQSLLTIKGMKLLNELERYFLALNEDFKSHTL